MNNWNGMTEPLEVGDLVRIVGCTASDMVGVVTPVVAIHPPGVSIIDNRGTFGGGACHTTRTTYMVAINTSGVLERDRLYKLPPDWDDRQSTTNKDKEGTA